MTRLLAKQRQRSIAELIRRDGQATVEDLCRRFGVSPATVRRDLQDLQVQGVVDRSHGGAVRSLRAAPELPVLQRGTAQSDAKARIGRAAARLVPDGATVFIASGTTPLEVARALAERQNITVITNALNVAVLLAELSALNVIVVGGALRRSELSLSGHLAELTLAELRADFVFLGAQAVSLEYGVSADNLMEVMIDRAVLASGEHRVLVADHSKFGKFAMARVAPLSSFDTIVTDTGLDNGMRDHLIERELAVVAA